MRKWLLPLVTLAGLTWTQGQAQDAKAELEKLAGTWSLTHFEEGGTKAPEQVLKTMEAVIQGNKFTFNIEGKLVAEFSLKLDADKNPKHLDFTYLAGKQKGETELGIYKFEADQVRICFNDVGKPRPTDFVVPEKSEVNMLVLKRKK